jgi:hypothetical protein
MKFFGSFRIPVAFGLVAAAAFGAVPVSAATNPAVVRNVQGSASVSKDNGKTWSDAALGQRYLPGYVLRTGPAGSVDLYLGEKGENGPVVRATEQTELVINKLASKRGSVETIIETELNLTSGRILGNVKKLSDASRYEVIIPQGVVGIRSTDEETEYAINASGVVHIVTGRAVVAYANPRDPNKPSIVTLTAGQTAYPPTQPGEEVVAQETPADIVSSLAGQFQGFQMAVISYVRSANPPAPAGWGQPTLGPTVTEVRIEPFVSPTTGSRSSGD